MVSKVFSTAAAALAAATVASAQTFTHCNPLQKDCPPDPAFGTQKINCNFADGACEAFHELDGTSLEYTDQGALFKIETETNAPTIATNNYIFFGRLDVEVSPAPGQGVITSLVLQSDDLDEIDWEWVGSDVDQVQTNYFSKGDTTTYDRGAYHPVPGAVGTTHTYSIDWTPEKIDWIVNGAVVRTLLAADAKGGSIFPQTPMQIKLGTWVAGRKDAPVGTVEWAGGYTDFSKAPFNAYYKSVQITDYAGGSGPAADSVKQYVYGDRSGSWQSIKVVKGEGSIISGGPDDSKDGGKDSSKSNDDVVVIEPATISKNYEKHMTTIDPKTPIPSAYITPKASEKSTTAAETTPSASKPKETSASSTGDSTAATDVPDAAGSLRVAVGTMAFAGVVALAQLI